MDISGADVMWENLGMVAASKTPAERPIRSLGRAQLRRRFGLWHLYEFRNRVTRGWRVPRTAMRERAELRRLKGQISLPRATVAIVIPTYKRLELLAKAVDSVLAQDYGDFVVVIVDDGAGEIPELPADSRLQVAALSRNVGCLGVVRNIGIALTDSTYIAFLDDDNEWTPDHLSTSISALEAGADLTYTTVERRFSDGRLFDVLNHPFDRHALRDEAFVDTNAIVVRRGPGVRFSRMPRTSLTFPKEDWEFVYRVSKGRDVRHVDVTTVRYLINDQSYCTPPWGSR
jgi:hypothetical protein